MNVNKTILDNGLTLLTIPVPFVRSVSITAFIAAGSRLEEEHEAGSSHLLEHMVFKGSRRWPSAGAISETIEGLGGLLNASTGRETTLYWVKIAQPHEPAALELLADMIMHPLMDPEEFEKERRVIIEEINMLYDSPESLVQIILDKLVWPDHPLGREISGTKESLSTITREQLIAYMDAAYGPQTTVLSIAGAIDPEETKEQIRAVFGDWRPVQPRQALPYEDQHDPAVEVVHKPIEQAHISLGFPSLSRGHPDRFALTLANTVLGDGMSSRLFQELRERQALAYSVDSFVSFLRDTGILGVYAGVDTARTEPALQAILHELRRMRDEPVSEEELTRAKEFNKGRLLLQMENTSAIASWYGRQEVLPGPVYSIDEVVELMDKVTPEDIQRVMVEILRPDQLHRAVVGPFEETDAFDGFLTAL